tara:strand:+ start:938 stop:1465 length:528 start_codon:yes stop_codon:yes gene_type:complete
MNFCSKCSSAQIEKKVPDGDTHERLVCTQCNEIFYSNPNIVTGVLPFNSNNEILLCKRNIEPRSGFWTLPAGFLENGESIEEGAVRETYEEALLKVENVNLFTILSVPHINQIYTFFTGEINGSSFGPTPESSEVKLFKINEIPWDELAFPTVKRTLQLFLEEDRNNVFNEVLKY